MTELARRIQNVMAAMDVIMENPSLSKEQQLKQSVSIFIDVIQSHPKDALLDALWEIQMDMAKDN